MPTLVAGTSVTNGKLLLDVATVLLDPSDLASTTGLDFTNGKLLLDMATVLLDVATLATLPHRSAICGTAAGPEAHCAMFSNSLQKELGTSFSWEARCRPRKAIAFSLP